MRKEWLTRNSEKLKAWLKSLGADGSPRYSVTCCCVSRMENIWIAFR